MTLVKATRVSSSWRESLSRGRVSLDRHDTDGHDDPTLLCRPFWKVTMAYDVRHSLLSRRRVAQECELVVCDQTLSCALRAPGPLPISAVEQPVEAEPVLNDEATIADLAAREFRALAIARIRQVPRVTWRTCQLFYRPFWRPVCGCGFDELPADDYEFRR